MNRMQDANEAGMDNSQQLRAASIQPRRPKVSVVDTQIITHSELNYRCQTGGGGFGTVYCGEYRGMEVAIKIVRAGGADKRIQEMEKEVEVLSNLRHPSLVEFIGASLDYPFLAIVTEFMAGGSLHSLLHIERVQLEWVQQIRIALQFAEGLQCLHNQKPRAIVHRDLKSLSVVLDGFLNCKICDFGLARTLDETHLFLDDGGNGGSPRYMAAECWDADMKQTEKVDTWAAGLILNENFGGSLPFEDCTQPVEIMRRLIIENQAPPIASHISGPLRAMMQKCLRFDIATRSSADEIHAVLLILATQQGFFDEQDGDVAEDDFLHDEDHAMGNVRCPAYVPPVVADGNADKDCKNEFEFGAQDVL